MCRFVKKKKEKKKKDGEVVGLPENHALLLLSGVLKCHCDICPDTNHTCETDGYCFASTSLENDVITYARR